MHLGGERITKPGLLLDENARIPFSVIGVFLILASSVTTVYISRLELHAASDNALTLDTNEIENLLQSVEADLQTALNIAGIKGIKEIGKTPIITSAVGTPQEVNEYRIKEKIRQELTLYVTSHFLSEVYSNGRYAINVVLPDEEVFLPIENITLQVLWMQLSRWTVPFIGPAGTMDHPAYWVASVPLTLDIRFMNGTHWKSMATRKITLSSLLTDRYLLLENLMHEFHQSINGSFTPLWTFTTVCSNLYSLIRGYKHYSTGKPLNVVDNHHLSVIVNSGLLLEQSLVFSSVDPLGLVELARQAKHILKKTPQDMISTFNQEMNGEGYAVDTDNISYGTANADADDPLETPIDVTPALNLSEIAEHILYNITSVTLHFENAEGGIQEELVLFDDDAQEHIDEVIQRYINQSYYLKSIEKHLLVNGTTHHIIESMINEIYHDTIATTVNDRQVRTEQWGDPGEGWTNGGASPWIPIDVVGLVKQQIKPEKGHVGPDSALFEELYNVTYQRTHYWWKMQEVIINGTFTLVMVWNNLTDYQIQTVTLHILLRNYTLYENSSNDIVDVLYVNTTLHDENLEDTLDTYRTLFPDSNPFKQQLIITQDNIGDIDLEDSIQGSFQEWVVEEAWNALNEILARMGEITLDPSISAINYPNPVALLEAVQEDLQSQFTMHLPEYQNFSQYHPGLEFCSVGKKAVYYAREWYTNEIQQQSEAVFQLIQETVHDAIATAIPEDAGYTSESITDVLDDASGAVHNQFTIPFGIDMNLERLDDLGLPIWTETIRLAVDQSPNFLDPYEKTAWDGEEHWTLKLRNRCLLGPTGVPLLPPTPVTPWLATLNVWLLDVEGEYMQVKIIDTSDETLFNPLLGHEPQVYVREAQIISYGNTTLGENTRVSFAFSTVCFGLVPAWGMMVGDVQDNWFDDHTPGYEEGD